MVLPTFILERRSLLEMYSDFFAHADFYSNIPNGKTPRDRLIAVIKWYLTSFHAGRNGSVAKKVSSMFYNEVLNSIFSHIIQFWENHFAVSGVPNQTQHQPIKIKKDQFHGRPNPMSPFSQNKWVTIPRFPLSMLKINPNQSNSLPIYGPSQSSWECPLVSKTKDSVHWVSPILESWF